MSMPGMWGAYRAISQDRSVVQRKLNKRTWRRVLTYAVPYRRLIAMVVLLLAVSAALVVAQPLLFKRIIDQGVSVGNASVVIQGAVLVAVIAVVESVLGLVSRWYSARIGEGLIFDLRTQVFSHVQRQSIAFFTRAQTGSLVSRLNSDVIGAQQAFTATLSGVLGNGISLIATLIAMFYLSWQITLGALLLLPLFLLPARLLGSKLQELTKKQFALNAEMSSQMTERFNVAGALLVKLFGRPEEEDHAFARRAGGVREAGIKIAMANRIFFTALTLVATLATALVYGVGGVLTVNGVLTVGTLLALAALLAQLYGPLTAVANIRVDVMTALVSFERVFEVLDLPPLVTDSPHAVVSVPGPATVTFKNVSFSYPRAHEVSLASLESIARPEADVDSGPVLNDVSFTVEPGQMVALVGPSGAGKTTLTSLVSRLYDPTAGTITFDGVDIRDLTLASLHQRVGVVTQEAHLFHDSIAANLRYAKPDATNADLLHACAQAQLGELIASLPNGLETVVGDRGHRLSGGEKQRLAIARLLLKAPDVVVLDEATAHLDSENELAVQKALTTALAGRTSIVIAHRLSTIRDADKILVLVDGRIAQQGTHAELIASTGVYQDLYQTQFASS